MIAVGFVLFILSLVLGAYAQERHWDPRWRTLWNLSVCGGWLGFWLLIAGTFLWLWRVAP